jgi:hypothetical protein
MLGSAYGRKTEKDEANISTSFTTKFASYSVACDIKKKKNLELHMTPLDLAATSKRQGDDGQQDQTKFKSQNLGDDVLSRSDSPTRNFLKWFSHQEAILFRKNSFSKKYQVLCFQYLLRKYIYAFCFEEIFIFGDYISTFCFWRKCLAQYILRKYILKALIDFCLFCNYFLVHIHDMWTVNWHAVILH